MTDLDNCKACSAQPLRHPVMAVLIYLIYSVEQNNSTCASSRWHQRQQAPFHWYGPKHRPLLKVECRFLGGCGGCWLSINRDLKFLPFQKASDSRTVPDQFWHGPEAGSKVSYCVGWFLSPLFFRCPSTSHITGSDTRPLQHGGCVLITPFFLFFLLSST